MSQGKSAIKCRFFIPYGPCMGLRAPLLKKTLDAYCIASYIVVTCINYAFTGMTACIPAI